jgi:aminoglycoside phosphotransferase (APT) family kinase protein
MSEAILKSHWERVSDHIEVDQQTAERLLVAYTPHKVAKLALLSNGCANTNYKLTLDNGLSVVLRIYVRDATALGREMAINELVNELLPAPRFLHVDTSCTLIPYPYAIVEWREGILLRDLIFTNNEVAISKVMEEAGYYLGLLRKLRLPMGGFFKENLQIQPFALEDEYFGFVMQLLQDEVVAESLGKNLQDMVQQVVSACANSIPEMNDANLTHGDYDPANILVKEDQGEWKISAILDWEFAHSGTYLLDMGLMLRYSHKMPTYVETSFIRGVEECGIALPSDWKKQAKLMDLLCLLQLLHANPASARPAMNRDVVRLINQIVLTLPKL